MCILYYYKQYGGMTMENAQVDFLPYLFQIELLNDKYSKNIAYRFSYD